MDKFDYNWQQTHDQHSIRYKCGYCNTDTSPSRGWLTNHDTKGYMGYVLICTYCNRPSFIHAQHKKVISTTPSAIAGNKVDGLSIKIKNLYNEARKCTSIKAYTSVVLTCRKILMHVAVEKGAAIGKKFIEYVDFLATNNYIPPDGKEWVDHIRSKSNEANHEIVIMTKDDADDLISFTEMLLRLVYEFKHRLKKDKPEVDDNKSKKN